MMKTKFNQTFWETKYAHNSTPWDIGHIATPLKSYFDQITNKNLKILIPGAGYGYEAEYLFNAGFKNVIMLDFASQPLDDFGTRVPNFPKDKLIKDDFFNHIGSYDLIVEQTFFCALDPKLRKEYVLKTHDLLRENGKLIGLFFDFPLTEKGPPFGGDKEEYTTLFSQNYRIKVLETAHNSINERATKELFAIFEKS